MDISSIDKLLRNHRTDGAIKTHVSMGRFPGAYMFDAKGLENLFETYCEDISKGVNVCLAEMIHPSKLIPVLVDIDIKVKETDEDEFGTQIYTSQHLESVIQIYQSVIRKIVDQCTDDLLLCIVLEKPGYRDKVNGISYLKNGFHLHFPNLFIHTDDQKTHLIPRINQELEAKHVFDDLKRYNCNVKVDDGYCSAAWLLYGSKKDVNKNPYTATKAINAHGEVMTIQEALSSYKIYDHSGYLIRYEQPIEYYLPRILSILPIPSHIRKRTAIKPQLLSPIKEKIKQQAQEKQKQHYKKSVEDDLKVAKEILPMIGDYRAEDRNEWMTIGWILYTISQGNQDGLDLWCEFSSRCEDSYDEAKCIYEWDRMVAKNFSLGTLRYFAMQDSPQEYDEYKKMTAKRFMENSVNLSGTHFDLAKLLYEEYKDEYVCSSLKERLGDWYRFNGLRWERDEQGNSLQLLMSTQIHDIFKSILIKEKQAAASATNADENENEDDDKQKKKQSKTKHILKIMNDLKKNPFKESVLKECKTLFYNKHFIEKLDTNKYLVGFKNGVYDLKNHKFRQGMPDDYISRSLGIEYKEFDPDGDDVRLVYDYLEKVFPNSNIRKYFLDIYSDVFVGGNQRKHIIFWTGSGDNAKSVTQTIFEKMMGEYATKLETQNVTGKRPNAGAANADIARLEGKRLCSIEEPSKKEEFNIGILKHLSGNDTCYARDLFERGKDTREFLPLFKLIIICNDLPPISHDDQAIWNRVRVIDFESKFCDPDKGEIAPESYEEQLRLKRFPMDKSFVDEKLPKILEPFAWVLLHHRKHLGCVIEPVEVKVSTDQFRKTNDTYRQFAEECIISTNKEKCITVAELYSRFKQWFKDAYPGYMLPIKEEVKKQYINLWKGSYYGNAWYGYKIKTDEDTKKEALSFLQEKEKQDMEREADLIAAFERDLMQEEEQPQPASSKRKRSHNDDELNLDLDTGLESSSKKQERLIPVLQIVENDDDRFEIAEDDDDE